MKEELETMLLLSHIQTSSNNQKLSTLLLEMLRDSKDGDQPNSENGTVNMMEPSNGQPMVGLESKDHYNQLMNSSD